MYIFDFELVFFFMDSQNERVDRIRYFVDRLKFFYNPKPRGSTNLTTKLIINALQKLSDDRKKCQLLEKNPNSCSRGLDMANYSAFGLC